MQKLNVGSGYKRYPGFINIDGDHHCSPDIHMNITTDIIPLADNSVDEVVLEHILEHLPTDGFFHLMKELYRVCCSGAILHITVPNPRHDIFLADFEHCRPIIAEGLRLLSKNYNQYHIDNNGSSSGYGIRYNIDFELIHQDYDVDPFYDEFVKNATPEEIMIKDREVNNFIMQNKFKLAVKK
jgi:hypothetical protein